MPLLEVIGLLGFNSCAGVWPGPWGGKSTATLNPVEQSSITSDQDAPPLGFNAVDNDLGSLLWVGAGRCHVPHPGVDSHQPFEIRIAKLCDGLRNRYAVITDAQLGARVHSFGLG